MRDMKLHWVFFSFFFFISLEIWLFGILFLFLSGMQRILSLFTGHGMAQRFNYTLTASTI